MPKQCNAGILVINCGSSSLKFSLFDSDSLLPVWSGSVSPIGAEKGILKIKTNKKKILENRSANFKNLAIAVNEVIAWLKDKKLDYPIAAIGHRLVQGGPEHREPEIINPQLLKTLDEYVYLAPNHLPEEIQTIKTFQLAFPDLPEVACFDTAFHKNMPPQAKYYPLPEKYKDKGLIKYGFHGLSYEYILQKLMAQESAVIKQNIIIAHLGNGASMVAVKDGISVDTTMGISPIGGLVMGTRCGDLDPGVLLFMLKQDKLTANQLDDVLSKDSGLKAIAGKSDVRDLLKAEADDPKSAAALTIFCYAARKFIGSLAAAMGGLDLLIFTGGIGENSTIIRKRICENLEFMGIEISKTRNVANDLIISKKKSRVSVRVIPTNEELMIARLTGDLLNHKTNTSYGNQNNEYISSPLSPKLLQQMHAYWRAANYLSVGQLYLRQNPLLKEPLKLEHIKNMLLGHWGTTPGQNFIYTHLNRIIKEYDLNMIYISGPGHGGPAVVAGTYLEGSYTEVYPNITEDEEGLKKLFTQFSYPGGISSHASPQTPGSIHEGGELGYSLSHAFGAVLDNPDLIVACVVGDGEAETGPLATAWHSNKFLSPLTDGTVLPILHLNGYKISNPTVLARISHEELEQLFRGYGWNPIFVEGEEPEQMHRDMAAALDYAMDSIRQIKHDAETTDGQRPRWPMVVLRSPKGWTGPKEVDGYKIEGNFRAHQIPLSVSASAPPEHLQLLESWLKSYKPEELFDEQGKLVPELQALRPEGERRMGSNPHANGGNLLRDLRLPDFRNYAVKVEAPGVEGEGDTYVSGRFLRDIIKENQKKRNFRIFGPDETVSNRLDLIFEATNRQWDAPISEHDEFLSAEGSVMEMLSEHQCEGWLEGYLLTGRHGLFNCYEAFIHIVDSMFNQHAKWLKATSELPWRRKIASLNILLTSTVWRQDHNGFTHQDPGFIDHVVNKKSTIVRVYLPPDANCLLSVMDHCLRSRHYVNVIVAGKHPAPQWLNMEQAIAHCTRGIGIWSFASNDQECEPDVVMACSGDVPTLETLAAVSILREYFPELKVRVINVVDLFKLEKSTEHSHGLTDKDYNEMFTTDKPVIFAFHGYPWLVHRLTYNRANNINMHVRGYKEEGTITTSFDMTVLNEMDRFHLVMDVIDRLPQTGSKGVYLKQMLQDKLTEHKHYINANGKDMPEILNWKWNN